MTAGIASGSDGRQLGDLIQTVTTTVTSVITNADGVVQTTTGTVTSIVTTPTTTSVVDTTTTAVTNIVNTTTGTVTDVLTTTTGAAPPATPASAGGAVGTGVAGVAGALAAVSGPPRGSSATVAPAALDSLLASVFGQAAPAAGDKTAPKISLRVLSRLKAVARTGRLKVRVVSDEPAVVALSTALRPGMVRRVHGRPVHVSRALIKSKPSVLAFRRAGPVTATVKLSRQARRTLGGVRTARVALQVWASDLARNQDQTSAKRTVRR